ncbi:hypothetical protein PICMEDRAFT_36723 [Pichia membranifaciens NRRL Y-2026]|uniref:DNA-directed RNA polymerase III subunit RPC3 n=1 Tax=Pichia membranifaciens NRRL Y-2026 TaxID=763406 RepID=A0A1E3NEY5_9ASCO|nr:hypothetical protein PICMEDRAFT_36723 [Pichia membranifaciens NRRL Y-2026]ODQ44690.1 hypothetical protein PICMEDRAFT_36723 [Pichia membranifaciens NRRL Y-2026]
MTASTNGAKLPSELPNTAKTQSPSCFLHSVILRAYVGEQAAYIYSCLHAQRKMTLSQLSQKSGIKGSNLRKVLVTLIQLGCVVYMGGNGKNNTYYCYNEEGCWKLTYIDEIVRHVREKFGQVHASVIQNVILRGHLTIGAYVSDLELKSEVDKIEHAFVELVEDKWLVHVKDMDFKPLSETFATCVRAATREFASNSGVQNHIKDVSTDAKDQTGLAALFNDDDDGEDDDEGDNASKGGKLLRRLNGNVPLTASFDRFLKYERDLQLVSMCRHRIGSITSKIYNVVLKRVEKSSREVRCIEGIVDRLVADASVGAGSAGTSTTGYDPATGRDLIKRLELKDQQKGMNFGAADILKELSLSNKYGITKEDLVGTIYNEDEGGDDMVSSKKRKLEEEEKTDGAYKKTKLSKLAAHIKTFDDDEDEDEDGNAANEVDNGFDLANNSENGEILTLILQHLKLLTIDKKLSFLIETTPGQFYVPFTMLQGQLPDYHMKQIVRTIFGNSSLRILNCIEEKRLIEEKNIAKSVLMREGDVRKMISVLIKFGLVEIQEIPRTADRSAMRGIFAFKVNKNYQRGKSMLGKCFMFNMGEVLEQMEQIKMENKILLDKISREDVRGHEVELLLESELAQLKGVVESEKSGLAKFLRLRAMGELFWFTDTE